MLVVHPLQGATIRGWTAHMLLYQSQMKNAKKVLQGVTQHRHYMQVY